MKRFFCILSMFGCAALPVAAQDNTVINGLPAGVLIYDATPAAAAVAPSVSTTPSTALVAPSTPFTLTPDPAPTVVQAVQSRASVRSLASPLPATISPVTSGAILDPATIAPQVDLAPGETVLKAIAVPSSIVKVPAAPPPAYTVTYEPSPRRAAPSPTRDPFTGRLRDTPGWTGQQNRPASIGCFPVGACAALNQR